MISQKKPKRLKSTSKAGQSLKGRANESKGKRKAELDKLSKVDKANYASAPRSVKDKIKKDYSSASKARVKNNGKYI